MEKKKKKETYNRKLILPVYSCRVKLRLFVFCYYYGGLNFNVPHKSVVTTYP